MYNRILAIAALLATLFTGFTSPLHAAEGDAQKSAPGQQSSVVNPFDPNSWMQHHYGPMRFNFAHPAGWAVFVDPKTHAAAHAALMNPATYAQFMQPQFWMQFANPNNWMAWMNPASYATFLNPATYLGWMRPEPYMHFIDPGMYLQMMNPAAYMALMNPAIYMQWMNPAAYSIPTGGNTQGAATFNWFDPNTWAQMMTPPAAPQAPTEQK
ncbi:MAG: hypothetical protein Kow006_01300 [Gammaproteobacteria bacterium]